MHPTTARTWKTSPSPALVSCHSVTRSPTSLPHSPPHLRYPSLLPLLCTFSLLLSPSLPPSLPPSLFSLAPFPLQPPPFLSSPLTFSLSLPPLIIPTQSLTTSLCVHAILSGTRRCQNGEIALAGGQYVSEGTIQICLDGVWGTVCDDLWDPTDAGVVCNILGYTNGQSSNTRILTQELY